MVEFLGQARAKEVAGAKICHLEHVKDVWQLPDWQPKGHEVKAEDVALAARSPG